MQSYVEILVNAIKENAEIETIKGHLINCAEQDKRLNTHVSVMESFLAACRSGNIFVVQLFIDNNLFDLKGGVIAAWKNFNVLLDGLFDEKLISANSITHRFLKKCIAAAGSQGHLDVLKIFCENSSFTREISKICEAQRASTSPFFSEFMPSEVKLDFKFDGLVAAASSGHRKAFHFLLENIIRKPISTAALECQLVHELLKEKVTDEFILATLDYITLDGKQQFMQLQSKLEYRNTRKQDFIARNPKPLVKHEAAENVWRNYGVFWKTADSLGLDKDVVRKIGKIYFDVEVNDLVEKLPPFPCVESDDESSYSDGLDIKPW